jgi:hypothetical protein
MTRRRRPARPSRPSRPDPAATLDGLLEIRATERERVRAAERSSDLRTLRLAGGIDSERAARLFPSRYGRV